MKTLQLLFLPQKWMQKPIFIAMLLFYFALPACKRNNIQKPHTGTQKMTVYVQGMHCSGCVNGIKAKLGSLKGVFNPKVTLKPQRAYLDYAPKQIKPSQILAAIRSLGYKAQATPFQATSKKPSKTDKEPEKAPASKKASIDGKK